MLEPVGSGSSAPRAFLRVAGKSIARHQLGLALALECQRIVCIARQFGSELIALQNEAEARGAQFHVISGPRGLSGLVTANDELLILADGLLASPAAAMPLLEGNHVVLVQPVESGIAAGFERLDLNHASAGAMRIPGRLVERLNELPTDCDAVSALQRIALQAGVSQGPVTGAAREGGRWQIVTSEAEAHAIEGQWFRLHLAETGPLTAVGAVARAGVFAFGPALLHRGRGSTSMALAALAVLLLATGAGWFGFITLALVLCAVAAGFRQIASLLGRIEQDSPKLARSSELSDQLLGIASDALLIVLSVWSEPAASWSTVIDNAFAPFVLVAVSRLIPRVLSGAWTRWVEDRLVLALLLAFASSLGVLHLALQAMVVVLIVVARANSGARKRITTV